MTKSKYNPYEEITNQVVQAMKDHGTNCSMPWQQNVKNGLPSNVVTGNHYRGINIWLLCFRNMPSPIWLVIPRQRLLTAMGERILAPQMMLLGCHQERHLRVLKPVHQLRHTTAR